MTRIFMTVLSMSLSGAVLILLVLLAGRVLKSGEDRHGRGERNEPVRDQLFYGGVPYRRL